MVSKVQTFEEFLETFAGLKKPLAWGEKRLAELAWQAAHENAARVCESVEDMVTAECPEIAMYCADAIRKAAK